ncbi:hypothetical protein [Klebsiella pneumoniae]|uniref:hypothetical protein n=1 Tax=Klebsiella pneumoniae TaxID=573 RepID=UPI0039867973
MVLNHNGRQFEADNLHQMEWVGRYLGHLYHLEPRRRFTARQKIKDQKPQLSPRQVLLQATLIPS